MISYDDGYQMRKGDCDTKHNVVTKPNHYMLMDGTVETKDLIRDRVSQYLHCTNDHTPYMGWLYGNAIKYMMRWPDKNGLEDIRKCKQLLNMMIEELT